MRDPNRTSGAWRRGHRTPGARTGSHLRRTPALRSAIARGYDPRRPGGWGLAFDAAVPENGEWHGPERRRRRPLREPPLVERRDSLLGRTRRLATRFKEPLIGLGLAGASLPLIRGARPAEEPAGAPEPVPAPAAAPAAPEVAAAAAAPSRDIEAEGATRWANAERTRVVQAAVDRYGIPESLAGDIFDNAKEQGIDPKLAYGLVKTESSFRRNAVSGVGARGLTQLMPRTAGWLEPGTRASDLFKPETNLRLGFKYLRSLIDKYDGNRKLALLAYNRGPGTVDRALRRGHDPDNGYAAAVMSHRLR